MPDISLDTVNRFHESIAAVCPIDGVADNGPGATPRFRIDFAPEATQAQRDAAAQAAAAFDPSDSAQTTWVNLRDRAEAKAIVSSGKPVAKVIRASQRVTYASLVEARNKVNELVAAVNAAHGTAIVPLVNRTFAQAVQSALSVIDAGQADS